MAKKLFATALATLLMMTNCDVARLDLQTIMDDEGSKCPRPAGVGMTLVKAELNDSCVLFHILYDNTYTNQFKGREAEIHAQLLENLNCNDETYISGRLIELASAARRSRTPILYRYENRDGNAVTDVLIHPDELGEKNKDEKQ